MLQSSCCIDENSSEIWRFISYNRRGSNPFLKSLAIKSSCGKGGNGHQITGDRYLGNTYSYLYQYYCHWLLKYYRDYNGKTEHVVGPTFPKSSVLSLFWLSTRMWGKGLVWDFLLSTSKWLKLFMYVATT